MFGLGFATRLAFTRYPPYAGDLELVMLLSEPSTGLLAVCKLQGTLSTPRLSFTLRKTRPPDSPAVNTNTPTAWLTGTVVMHFRLGTQLHSMTVTIPGRHLNWSAQFRARLLLRSNSYYDYGFNMPNLPDILLLLREGPTSTTTPVNSLCYGDLVTRMRSSSTGPICARRNGSVDATEKRGSFHEK
ncbi:hypothetical protein ON010_g10175 [Phytophthora cinnamomi]|nr:hypothetical protein ON010_g10175 [Phytophthora cinnamomi]